MGKTDKLVSTTNLAKTLNTATGDLFGKLLDQGLITRNGNEWALTEAGEGVGGQVRENDKYGKYIVWPESLAPRFLGAAEETGDCYVSATKLGEPFGVSAHRTNQILSELGWIAKATSGWEVTKLGASEGGVQKEYSKTGGTYVVWPQSVLANKRFVDNIKEIQGEKPTGVDGAYGAAHETGFREKFEAKLRTTDGHYVRSKAEMLIDNWLYMAEIAHAYERKLPVKEEVYCDFYIPSGKVYIEYWGYENDAKYVARKKEKQSVYAKYGFNLIELDEAAVQNLDDVLPTLLLNHGVQSY